MLLAGSVVLVTGASRGIGRATADELTRRGALVVGVGRDEPSGHGLAGWVVADLLEPASAEQVVAAALAIDGRLNAVVANAGVGYAGEFASMPAAALTELLDLNVRAPLLLARAAVPALQSAGHSPSGAAIVFVSSIAGAVGVPGESAYSAGKAALEAFAPLLAEELRPDGIAVTTVLPGVVDTDFLRARGVPYDRRFPRPMPPARVATVIADALESGRARRIEPRWLGVPARLASLAPATYRRLARRFG